MVYDVIRLELVLGTPPSFFDIFASIVIVLIFFNLVDAVIIDWLILLVVRPGLGVLPGTEGVAGYKDSRWHPSRVCWLQELFTSSGKKNIATR